MRSTSGTKATRRGPQTLAEISLQLRSAGLPRSIRQIQRYIREIGIPHAGIRTRPAVFPAGTGTKIVLHLRGNQTSLPI